MKIKNTKELKLRARSHAKADHIVQNTYGDASTNGKTEYQGCAVSCLATPHRKDDLRAYIIEHGTEGGDGYYYAEFNGEDQRARVAKQFGITQTLMVVAEGLFESQPHHGGAIEFVKDFACALNEGADISPRMVQSWCIKNLGREVHSFDDVEDAIEWGNEFCSIESVEDGTKTFLSWLRSITPKPVVA